MKKTVFFGLLIVMLAFFFIICDNNNNGSTTYSVTFNSNDGSNVQTITGIISGTTITLPENPTKLGNNFSGWFIDNETFQNEFNSSTVITSNLTVYAKWSVINYSVIFNSNEGSAVDPILGLINGDNIIAPPIPTRSGFKIIFLGWYDQELENAFDFDTPISNNITLYAKWRSYELGEIGPGGGIIFYCNETGFTMTDNNSIAHYLEAAPNNMVTVLAWASSFYFQDVYIDGTEREIGAGRKNTNIILDIDIDAPAARACFNYTAFDKTDWFLPSINELAQLRERKEFVGNLI